MCERELQVGKAESLLQSGGDRGKRHRLPEHRSVSTALTACRAVARTARQDRRQLHRALPIAFSCSVTTATAAARNAGACSHEAKALRTVATNAEFTSACALQDRASRGSRTPVLGLCQCQRRTARWPISLRGAAGASSILTLHQVWFRLPSPTPGKGHSHARQGQMGSEGSTRERREPPTLPQGKLRCGSSPRFGSVVVVDEPS